MAVSCWPLLCAGQNISIATPLFFLPNPAPQQNFDQMHEQNIHRKLRIEFKERWLGIDPERESEVEKHILKSDFITSYMILTFISTRLFLIWTEESMPDS